MTATLTNADPAATKTDYTVGTPEQAVGRALIIVLGLLTIFGPISMDLYLPVLPALTVELKSATSTAQLTVTACLLGLAIGQVITGPLSDRFGRRRPLLVGVVAYVVTSTLCALSPTIETLIVARFVQGLAGAVGIVITQAAGRDLYSGPRLVRYYGQLTVLGGLAAIIGPVIGGQLASVTDWRGLFLFLAAVGVAILIASIVIFRETLPREHRVTGELTHMAHDFRRLLADRVFLVGQGHPGDRARHVRARGRRAAGHRSPAPAPDRRDPLAVHDGQRRRRHLPTRDLARPSELPQHRRHRVLTARASPLRVRRPRRTPGRPQRRRQRRPARTRHRRLRRARRDRLRHDYQARSDQHTAEAAAPRRCPRPAEDL